MISDEQRNAFEKWATSQQFCLGRFNSVDEYMNDNTHFAWEGWQAAQKVKPLDFVRIDTTTKKADTAFGPYFICDYIDEVRMALPEETNYYGRGYKTEDEAIEAANIDNRRRVLGCLVNGGV